MYIFPDLITPNLKFRDCRIQTDPDKYNNCFAGTKLFFYEVCLCGSLAVRIKSGNTIAVMRNNENTIRSATWYYIKPEGPKEWETVKANADGILKGWKNWINRIEKRIY